MTRFKTLAFAVLFGLSSLCGAVTAAETPAQKEAHQTIAANYLRYGRAFEAKDLPAILTMTAPNYTSRGLRGEMQNRAQFEREMRAAFASAVRVEPAWSQIRSLFWRNGEAIVYVKQRIGFSFAQGKKLRHFRSLTVARDVWTRAPRGWQVRQSVTVAQILTLDGQKISP